MHTNEGKANLINILCSCFTLVVIMHSVKIADYITSAHANISKQSFKQVIGLEILAYACFIVFSCWLVRYINQKYRIILKLLLWKNRQHLEDWFVGLLVLYLGLVVVIARIIGE